MIAKIKNRIIRELVGLTSFYSERQTAWRKILNFSGRFRFWDHSNHSDLLLVVLAGYKEDAWPITFNRLKHFTPRECDVCVVSPGIVSPALQVLCAANNWSYLSTNANQLSPAVNFAIRCHPNAKVIIKMDEDIVIAEGFYDGLLAAKSRAEEEGRYDIGLVAPLLNVNGYSYRLLLEEYDRLEDYRNKMGDWRQSAWNTSAQRDPAAAKYLWDLSSPFDLVAAHFKNKAFAYSVVPHRFSIGCIMFDRSLWDAMGGFTAAPEGWLGVDESDVCAYCCDNSKVIAVAHNVFAGHIGFGSQTKALLPLLLQRPDLLNPGVNVLK
jgi:hypothetical protein